MKVSSPLSEPTLLGTAPRRVRFSPSVLIWYVFLLNFCLGTFTVGFWFSQTRLSEVEKFQRVGKRTLAQVIGVRAEQTGNAPHYYLRFQYEAGERTLGGETEITVVRYAIATRGSSLLITYLPDAPERWRVGEVTETEYQELQDRYLLYLLVWGVGCAAIYLMGAGRLHYEHFMLSKGDAVAATVQSVTDGELDSEGRPTAMFLNYSYPLRTGNAIHETLLLTPEQHRRLNWTAGDTFTVLRHPDSGYTHRPLFLMTKVELAPLPTQGRL